MFIEENRGIKQKSVNEKPYFPVMLQHALYTVSRIYLISDFSACYMFYPITSARSKYMLKVTLPGIITSALGRPLLSRGQVVDIVIAFSVGF